MSCLPPCYNVVLSLSASHRKNSPSLPNANSSNHDDQRRWRPAVRQNPFLANQQALLLLQALSFYELSSERNRTQSELCFYYVHDFFFLSCAHLSPFLFGFIWIQSRKWLDWKHHGIFMVRWSRLLLPRNLRTSSYGKQIGKEWFPTLLFMETNQLLRVF